MSLQKANMICFTVKRILFIFLKTNNLISKYFVETIIVFYVYRLFMYGVFKFSFTSDAIARLEHFITLCTDGARRNLSGFE